MQKIALEAHLGIPLVQSALTTIEQRLVGCLHKVDGERTIAVGLAHLFEWRILHRIYRMGRERCVRIIQKFALTVEVALSQAKDLGKGVIVDAARPLCRERCCAIGDIANHINALQPHHLVGLCYSLESLRVGECATHLTHTLGKCGKASTLGYRTLEIGEFEMRVGIDKASTQHPGVELHARHRVERVAILRHRHNLVRTILRNTNRYEGSGLKPLWCQQIVRGYLS